jgi:hypothetical protein
LSSIQVSMDFFWIGSSIGVFFQAAVESDLKQEEEKSKEER